MNWKETIQSVRESGQKIFDQQSDALIHEHWPKIQTLFQEKVGPAALKAAQDDAKMQQLFKFVYELLPLPVHLAVKEKAFVKFCLDHRNELLPAGKPKTEAAGK